MSQTHPQYTKDRQTLNQLQREEPGDFHLSELARLIVRYRGFPGADDIQRDLAGLLRSWKLTEETLFQRTRRIHSERPTYRGDTNQEDWS